MLNQDMSNNIDSTWFVDWPEQQQYIFPPVQQPFYLLPPYIERKKKGIETSNYLSNEKCCKCGAIDFTCFLGQKDKKECLILNCNVCCGSWVKPTLEQSLKENLGNF